MQERRPMINRDRLVIQSVMGRIHHPTNPRTGEFRLTHDGKNEVYPSVGGITYNVKIGDSVYGMDCDHVEPGVSLKNPDSRENDALCTLACIGNEAVVVSGDAKGARGYVTGTHGGIDHVLLYFAAEDLDRMLPDDRILIRSCGQGMRIEGMDEIKVMNLDPGLFDRLGMVIREGKLVVPVAAKVPFHLMGAGTGQGTPYSGDWDIMTADKEELARHGLDKLRYGDLVLVENCDSTYGRGYLTGAVSVGVIVHSDCTVMGHGPGVTTILSCKRPLIEGVLDKSANLADYLGV